MKKAHVMKDTSSQAARAGFPPEVLKGTAATVLTGISVLPSTYVDSCARSVARGAAQGEAAAILAQGCTLLDHSGKVHLQQARRG